MQVGINADDDNFENIKVVYSFDAFSTASHSELIPNAATSKYSGNLLLNFNSGKVNYYIEATTADNRTYRYPSDAPAKSFSLNIGPDYIIPNLFHNPVKLLTGNLQKLEMLAEASDNMGIQSIKVDYKVNGNLQDPIYLSNDNNNLFKGAIQLPFQPEENDVVEYRITATDISARNNVRSFPAIGFQEVKVFSPHEPVLSYSTNFENADNDFVFADFTVSPVSGFSGSVLHTFAPYPVSAIENTRVNIIAQLKYPVVIQKDGLFKFDEVVLVEPGEQVNQYNEPVFYDYVIVEASKDGGSSWLPLSEKYNSGSNNNWYSAFTKSYSGNSSTALPHESMFVNHTINLTRDTGLEAGDTAIFRFRLASDNSVSGFGWAIDNLEIQEFQDNNEELFAEGSFLLYPNPARNHLYIEWNNRDNDMHLDVIVTDLLGKIVRQQHNIEPTFAPKTIIDLTDVNPGIYLVSINQGREVLATNKIIKN